MGKHALMSVILLSFVPVSQAGVTGEIEALKLVADRFEASYEKLKTWRGTARITSSVLRGKGDDVIRQQGVYHASFLADWPLKAARWQWIPQEEALVQHGQKTIQDSHPTGGMSKEDYDFFVYYYDLGTPHEERSFHVHRKGDLPTHFESTTFNPIRIRDSFAPPSMARHLRSYYDHAGSPNSWQGRVIREDNKVTFSISQEFGDSLCTERRVFDLSQGGSLVEYYNDSPGMSKTHWQVSYEEISGVFVMKQVSLTSINTPHDITSKRTAVITTDWVNQALSEEEFSLTKLGIKSGDSVRNHVNNERYIFGEDIVEADIVPLIIKDLLDQSLPSFDGIRIAFDAEAAKGHPVLLCFMDIGQRPSRHCIADLVRQSERFSNVDLQVLAIQASAIDESELSQWLKDNGIDLTVGRVTGHVRKVHAAWGVRALPWLILTDKRHRVTRAGFPLSELEATLKRLGLSGR